MDYSTASARLLKNILFDFAVRLGKGDCVRCGQPMTRESFSIEHVIPWLDNENPVAAFFDLSNIGFSHKSCNSKAARRTNKIYLSKADRIAADRRIRAAGARRTYSSAKRREKFIKTGH